MSEENPPSSELRRRFEQEYALPLARAIFELEPRCQSVLITVGQYWCDEATDAVHSETIACAEREPRWPESAQARPGALGDADALAEALASDTNEGGEPGSLSEIQYSLMHEATERAFGEPYFSVLDENSDMIVAFASYCQEVSDQEQPSWRSHTPYGLIRRPIGEESPSFEVIGRMHRPQWEDRWDVLENDGLISEMAWQDEGAGTEKATAAASTLSAASSAATSSAPTSSSSGPARRILLFAALILLIVLVRSIL
ncbi:MAG TPA: hypothetical protein VLC09_12670 [Polyangiaceae bacterium]|nr:hypothetical protein [Polyangiaceae bacterium]